MTTDIAEPPEKPNEDEYHLQLLGIFYYIVAGLTALVGCFPLLHVVFGMIMVIVGAANNQATGPMPILGGMLFTLVGGAVFLIFQAVAVGMFLAGRYLHAHRHHTYCLVIAVIICFSFPIGTVLGVFTILVLIRPEVRSLFGAN